MVESPYKGWITIHHSSTSRIAFFHQALQRAVPGLQFSLGGIEVLLPSTAAPVSSAMVFVGEFMEKLWWMYRKYMVNTWWIWETYGEMEILWWIHREYMVYVYGKYMELSGITSKIMDIMGISWWICTKHVDIIWARVIKLWLIVNSYTIFHHD